MTNDDLVRCPTCGTTCTTASDGAGGEYLRPEQNCLCWPPGSGEEWCTGHCLAREEVFGVLCGMCREVGPPRRIDSPAGTKEWRQWVHDYRGLTLECGAAWARDRLDAKS